MVSEENFSLGAFQGYPSGHRSRNEVGQMGAPCPGHGALPNLTLVSLRPFRASVFSAYVRPQEQWSRTDAALWLVKQGDVMGMYGTSTFRQEVASHFGADVHALAFEDVIKGDVAFKGSGGTPRGTSPTPGNIQGRKGASSARSCANDP